MSLVNVGIHTVAWLKEKAREWAQDVVKLYSTAVPAELQTDKQRLIDRARTIKDSIEKVTGPLQTLQPINEMGAIWLPVVGAVGVGAVAAAIAYWYNDYKKLIERMELNNQLISEGVASQAERNRLINEAIGDKSMVEKLFNPKAFLPLAVVVLGVVYFWRRN